MSNLRRAQPPPRLQPLHGLSITL